MCFLRPAWRLITGLFEALALFFYHSFIFCLPYCCRRKKSLKNRNILITGTGSGIGRELALALAPFEPVLLLWSKVAGSNEETVKLVKEQFGEDFDVHAFTVDVGDREQVIRTAVEMENRFGPIDILINNAGTLSGRYIQDLTEEQIEDTFRSNLFAHYWTIQSVLPSMLKRDSGHIVAIGSVAGIVGTSHLTDYCATKFGITGLMESLDAEVRNQGKKGINFTTVFPYFVNTGLFGGIKTHLHCLLPILKAEYVAKCTVEAMRCNQEQVYLPRMLYCLLGFKGLLPVAVIRHLGYLFGAHTAMLSFRARNQIV